MGLRKFYYTGRETQNQNFKYSRFCEPFRPVYQGVVLLPPENLTRTRTEYEPNTTRTHTNAQTDLPNRRKMSNHVLTEILVIVSGILAIWQLIKTPSEKNEVGTISHGTLQIISLSIIGILTGLFGQWLSEEIYHAAEIDANNFKCANNQDNGHVDNSKEEAINIEEHNEVLKEVTKEESNCRYTLSALTFCILSVTGFLISSIFVFLNFKNITNQFLPNSGQFLSNSNQFPQNSESVSENFNQMKTLLLATIISTAYEIIFAISIVNFLFVDFAF